MTITEVIKHYGILKLRIKINNREDSLDYKLLLKVTVHHYLVFYDGNVSTVYVSRTEVLKKTKLSHEHVIVDGSKVWDVICGYEKVYYLNTVCVP